MGERERVREESTRERMMESAEPMDEGGSHEMEMTELTGSDTVIIVAYHLPIIIT